MCQCSWGTVHTPDTACPLYVAPQPVAKVSVKKHAKKKQGVRPRVEGLGHSGVIATVPR